MTDVCLTDTEQYYMTIEDQTHCVDLLNMHDHDVRCYLYSDLSRSVLSVIAVIQLSFPCGCPVFILSVITGI
jgi:hypothetical protein